MKTSIRRLDQWLDVFRVAHTVFGSDSMANINTPADLQLASTDMRPDYLLDGGPVSDRRLLGASPAGQTRGPYCVGAAPNS